MWSNKKLRTKTIVHHILIIILAVSTVGVQTQTVLQLKPSFVRTQIGEEVSFEIIYSADHTNNSIDYRPDSVEYAIDFDDDHNRLIADWTNETSHRYRYLTPGRYRPTVYAKLQTDSVTRILSNDTWIEAMSTLDEQAVQFDCPRSGVVGEPTLCNLTVSEGYSLNASIDFGDGLGITEFALPDVPNKILGTGVPQYHSARMLDKHTLKKNDLLVIQLRSERLIDSPATILAVEGFCSVGGGLQLSVIRKICPQSRGHHSTIDICRLFPPNEDDKYLIVKTITLSDREGHFYVRINASDVRVIAGDMIAIRSEGGGQLASRRVKRDELPDFRVDNFTDSVLDRQKFHEVEGRKHLIRLVVSEPLRVVIPVEANKSGLYNVTFAVGNRWTSKPIVRERSLEIRNKNE